MKIVTKIISEYRATSPFGTTVSSKDNEHLGYMIVGDNKTIFTNYDTARHYAAGRTVTTTQWNILKGIVKAKCLTYREIMDTVICLRKMKPQRS